MPLTQVQKICGLAFTITMNALFFGAVCFFATHDNISTTVYTVEIPNTTLSDYPEMQNAFLTSTYYGILPRNSSHVINASTADIENTINAIFNDSAFTSPGLLNITEPCWENNTYTPCIEDSTEESTENPNPFGRLPKKYTPGLATNRKFTYWMLRRTFYAILIAVSGATLMFFCIVFSAKVLIYYDPLLARIYPLRAINDLF